MLFQTSRARVILFAILVLLASPHLLADSPSEIYQRRIVPLIRSPEASSCRECHLHGLDLKQFLHEDPLRTFVELRANGWIDLDQPEKSKILEFIAKRSDQTTEIQNRVRSAEFVAMKAWIIATVQDPSYLATPVPKFDDLSIDSALVVHARADQVVDRFIAAIWSQLERCANCHSPDRNASHVEKHGEQMSWIVPQSPGKTLQLLVDRKLIDLDRPPHSLIRTKAIGDQKHGGGIKFPTGGQTDRQWLQFLVDYACIVQGVYQSSAELPKLSAQRNWRSSLHIKIVDFPDEWANRFLRIELYRSLPDQSFETSPSAFGEARVSQEKLSWGNSFSLLEKPSKDSVDSSTKITLDESLPDGIYQAKIFSDELNADVLVSVEELEKAVENRIQSIGVFELRAPWASGHSSAKTFSFSELRMIEK